MSDTARLLERIEHAIVEHGGDLGGWTKLADESLQLFDGRITLRAEIREMGPETKAAAIHAHVFATLHEHDDEVLDACICGIGDTRDQAIAQVAFLWLSGVAGPIKSFLDNRPVCMTCQAGVAGGDVSQGYSPSDYGLPGLRAFVGPSFARAFHDPSVQNALEGSKPWFRHAAECAAPRRVHLAKATLVCEGKKGWRRELEIDGHDISHQDPDWPAGIVGPEFGYLTRFAVFEFPRNSQEIRRRAELERTIRHFAEQYSKWPTVNDLMADMENQGFDPDLVHEVESISMIAFGRVLFEQFGISYSPTIIRARDDGRIETDVPLASLPAYNRGRALAAQLRETMPREDFERLGCYTAESNALIQMMEAQGDKVDFTKVSLFPCIVPDRNVPQATMDAAVAKLQAMLDAARAKKKPWWKFW